MGTTRWCDLCKAVSKDDDLKMVACIQRTIEVVDHDEPTLHFAPECAELCVTCRQRMARGYKISAEAFTPESFN